MTTMNGKDVHKIVIACDAGMGSSVMLAGQLKKQLKKSGVVVEHAPVAHIPEDADVVVTNAGLADRARQMMPNTPVVSFQLFMGDPNVAKVVKAIQDGTSVEV